MVTRDPKKAVEKVKRHAGIGENLPKPEHIRIHGDAQRSEKWAITQSGDEHAVGGGGGEPFLIACFGVLANHS